MTLTALACAFNAHSFFDRRASALTRHFVSRHTAMVSTLLHRSSRKQPAAAGAFALCLALGLCCTPASATGFSTFQQFESSQDSQLASDGYPGRMKLLNYRSKDVCVYFRYLDDSNQVLRMSRTGARLPASRQDLGVTGPGVNARRLEIGILPLGEPIIIPPVAKSFGYCPPFDEVGFLSRITVRAGEVKQGAGYEVDARSWSGNSRDITVNIR